MARVSLFGGEYPPVSGNVASSWASGAAYLLAHWRDATMAAVAICSMLAGYQLDSWFFVPVAVLLIGATAIDSRNPHVNVFAALVAAVIVLSGVWAVYAQKLAGDPWQITAVLLVYPALYSLIIFLRPSPHFWAWIIPFGAVHAGMIFVQTIQGVYRPTGLTDSANPAGGLLAILAIVLLRSKWWPLTPLFVIPMLLTGSRLAVLSFVVALCVSLAMKHIKLLPVAILAASVGLFLIAGGWETVNYHLLYRGSLSISGQVIDRVYLDFMPGLSPNGYDAGRNPIHSLYLLVFAEYGLLAVLALLALLAKVLIQVRSRPRLSIAIVLLVLASLDLYLWFGPMAWAWWWLLSYKPSTPVRPPPPR